MDEHDQRLPLEGDLLEAGLAAGFSPPTAMAAPAAGATDEERRAQIWFGDYRVIREVGRGGMGVVYEAEQASLGRRVALKVLPYHGLRSSAYVERFRREAQAAAQLHHTNIVTVYGVGEHRGIPYYAMRFIEGKSLDTVLRELSEHRGGPREGVFPEVGSREFYRRVARLGAQAAGALAYAHERGVLHRDIKPSNLLLDREGDVWITDFGLAKSGEAESLTQSGDLLGTIRYMAPERFEGSSLLQGDVYSLGLTLYEILTQRPAFAGGSREGLIDKVLKQVPPTPRRLDARIPRDLETIVLKASAKIPSERYASAALLADDLRRFLEDRPILARRASASERTWRWCRRNPLVAGLGGGMILLLAALAVSSIEYAAQLKVERDQVKAEQGKTAGSLERAEKAERERTQDLYRSYVAQAGFGRLTGRAGQAFGGLDAIRKAIRLIGAENLSDAQMKELRNEAIACLGTPDISVLEEKEPGMKIELGGIAFDSRMERYTHAEGDGSVVLRSWGTGEVLARLRPTRGATFWYTHASFSPDDRFLLIHYVCSAGPHLAVVWDLRTMTPARSVDTQGNAVLGDGGAVLVAASEGGTASGFDLDRGREVFRVGEGLIDPRLRLDRSGRRLAAAIAERLLVYDALSGEKTASFTPGTYLQALAWSAGGRWLAAGGADHHVYVYDLEERSLRSRLEGHEGQIIGLGFVPGSPLLSSVSWDATTRLWDPLGGKERVRVDGSSVGWSPDGARLGLARGAAAAVCAVAQGNVCRWLRPGRAPAVSRWNTVPGPYDVDWSADGRWLASAHADGVRLWDASRHGEEAAFLPVAFVESVRFEPLGRWLLSYGELGLWRWPLGRDGEDPENAGAAGPAPLLLGARKEAERLSLDREGRTLAYIDQGEGRIAIHSLSEARDEAKRVVLIPSITHAIAAVLSPDGSLVAGMRWKDSAVLVWSADTGLLVATLPASDTGDHGVYAQSAAFSPDGRWLVTGDNRSFRVWAVGAWELASELPRPWTEVGLAPASFSREGDLLALSIDPRAVTLVASSTWEPLAVLTSPDPQVITAVSFSAGAALLAVATQEGAVQLWDLEALSSELALLGLDRGFPALPASPRLPASPHAAARPPIDAASAERVRNAACRNRCEEILRSLRELAPRWIERGAGTRSEARRELEASLGILAAGEFRGWINGSAPLPTVDDVASLIGAVRTLVGGMRDEVTGDEPRPDAPRNIIPADGARLDDAPVILGCSPFRSSDARDAHGWSRIEVREAGGTYERNPAYAAFIPGSASRWTLPEGLLLSHRTYLWRAAHVGVHGRISEFSAETSFLTGELGLEPVSFDLAQAFNRDLVADPGDMEEDEFDPGNGDRPQLTVEGFDGARADNPGIRGLPPDRVVGVHRLGEYSRPNAVQVSPDDHHPLHLPAPPGRHAAVRFLLAGGWGDSEIAVTLRYASGREQSRRLHCDNSLDELPPTHESALAEGSSPVWDGMSHLRGGGAVERSDLALSEVIVPASRAEELEEVVLEPGKGAFDRAASRFNLFAVTGMRVR